ncbi:MAG TPA: outer membrane beta-barrel protein [Alphaproteobacteria bacterium]|nr:outer membrane beta-barrel protein [Alphaproteobacteria bacterium]
MRKRADRQHPSHGETGMTAGLLLLLSTFASDGTAWAADAARAAEENAQPAQTNDAGQQPAAPAGWLDAVKLYGHLEAGITGNPNAPRRNFGRLFDDHTNEPSLNQLMVTAERPLDPKATGYDFGFKLQGLYGSDARFTHVYGQFNWVINDTNQIAIVEAYGSAHLPILTDGGMNVKLGQFASPMSAEAIDATQNSFYSHSYIFNFGVPFQHTGVLTTTHVNSVLDIYAGLDTGVNAWLGSSGDGLNNDTLLHGQGGVGLTLLGGDLTIMGLTHIGPENPKRAFGNSVNDDLRYINDGVITWKASDKLTFTTDLNYVHDDGLRSTGYGGAQYVAYTLNNWLTFVGRGEVWRDNNGAFVASFNEPLDFVRAERGFDISPGGVVSGGRTTYGALTGGVNVKPQGLPKAIDGFVIRPELRYDRSLNGTAPFNNSTSHHSWTIAADFILPLAF